MALVALSAGSTSVGEYTLLRRLESARGRLFQARKADGTECTLAFVDLRRSRKASVYSEVWRCRRLSQPGILRVIEAMSHGDEIVLVFESVRGVSLSQLMRHLDEEGERVADRALLHVGHTLFAALAEAHGAAEAGERPILHAELGPHQVLVSWRGEVKVLGFGLSPLIASGPRPSPDWLLPFVAPEVRRGQRLTAEANVYSAAAVLWSLLARRSPPRLMRRPPRLRQLRPDLDGELCEAIDRTLDPTPSRRLSAAALAELLDRRATSGDVEELRWNMEIVRATHAFEDDVLPSDAALANRSWRPRPSLGPLSDADLDDDVPTREMVVPGWLAEEAAEGASNRGSRTVSGVQRAIGGADAAAAPLLPGEPKQALTSPSRGPEPGSSEDSIEVIVEAPRSDAPIPAPPRAAFSSSSAPSARFLATGSEGAPASGMMPNPSAGASPSLGWLGAIAVISIASFGGGLFASRLGIELRMGDGHEREAVADDPPAVVVPVPETAPVTATRHEPRPAIEQEPPVVKSETSETSDPSEATESSTASENEQRAAALRPDRGLLRVSFAGDPSGRVYVNGLVVGDTGAMLEVDCGMRFVRVGDAPLLRWFSAGAPVRIACQKLTEVAIEPGAAAPETSSDDPYAAIRP